MKFRQNNQQWLFLLTLFGLIAFAFLISYIGHFSRFLADDYCTAAVQRNSGTWNVVTHFYETWSGRYSFFLTIAFLQGLGVDLVRYLPGITLLIWIVCTGFVVYSIDKNLRWINNKLVYVFLAFLLPVSVLAGIPDLYQSFYWQTGLVTYTLPLVLFSLILAIIFMKWGRRSSPGSLILFGLLTFFAGGFSETYVCMQTTLFLLLLLMIFIKPAFKDRLPILAVGLAASVLAMIVMTSAPGNAVRLGLTPDTPPIAELVFLTLRYSAASIVKGLIHAPFLNLVVIISSLLLGAQITGNSLQPNTLKVTIQRMLMVGLAGGVLILASIFPSAYATAAYPAERALITSQLILVLTCTLLGVLAGHGLLAGKSAKGITQLLSIAVLLLTIAGIGNFIASNRALESEMMSYSQQWDRRHDEALHAVSMEMQSVALPSLPHLTGLAELDPEPDYWINTCMARFYGFQEISIR